MKCLYSKLTMRVFKINMTHLKPEIENISLSVKQNAVVFEQTVVKF